MTCGDQTDDEKMLVQIAGVETMPSLRLFAPGEKLLKFQYSGALEPLVESDVM